MTKQRQGEIALMVLQKQLEADGELKLKPKEVKRDITNQAKSLGIPVHEAAQFAIEMYKTAYEKTIAELETIKDPASEKQ